MPYRVRCRECPYEPRVLNFPISAQVTAEHHTLVTGHQCRIEKAQLSCSTNSS
jgi:hypothetical protein